MKRLSLLLAALLLCMGLGAVNAEEETQTQTLTVVDDLYIDKFNGDTNYEKYSGVLFQANNNETYQREGWLRFDLDQAQIPDGYYISGAKLQLFNIANYNAANATVQIYSLTSSDYDASHITWNLAGRPTRDTVLGSMEIEANIRNGTAEIDISNYFTMDVSRSDGYQAFAFFPSTKNINGAIGSIEQGEENAAKLVLTYSPLSDKSSDVLEAISVANIASNAADTPYTGNNIQNKGSNNNAGNRMAFVKFDLSTLEIPDGKVITGATLRWYFTNNYSNKDHMVGIFEVEDNDWLGTGNSAMTWNSAPAFSNADPMAGTMTVPSTRALNAWVEGDVTSFIARRYYDETSDWMASMRLFPEGLSTDGGLYWDGTVMPQLVVSYGDPIELSVGQAQYYSQNLESEAISSFNDTGTHKVVAPVTYAGETPVEYTIYAARYDAQTGALEDITSRAVTLYSANGGIGGLNLTFSVPDPEGYYVKTIVLDSNGQPIFDSAPSVASAN